MHGSVPGHRNCLLKVKVTRAHMGDTPLGVEQEGDVIRGGFIVLTETGDLSPVWHRPT